ncbi:acetoin dehydrogenase dihydrolipoyllysine-residue acetyltransferase subunit [Roseobacter weihaiensis]|uniref:acetoin dehydrogenase dihydrolipoyllysine-residue acetyltransferase subunit n=1 Tax=Roseobacter weihaiensis TaxID=2763262 RepID=UPI001D09BAF0|nr:acetoin dehydrogenase dihydrolipoyllysine-residue acetyltransferase subunit [Roseobacter sp. H9]
MTTLTLPMPRLGETMEEGTIAEWLVKPGQSFKRGDPLVEVETDKTLVEYPALGDGTLRETLVRPGDVVEVGAPIAMIETDDLWDGIKGEETAEAAVENVPAQSTVTTAQPAPRAATPRATPLARRIAKTNGISLDDISGTGRRGRIEAADVRLHVSGRSRPATASLAAYFVHGFAGLGSNWAALRAVLQRKGMASVAPDLPGHGRNAADAPDVETLVDWLVGELENQPEPVHLIGHSLGAYLATQAALRAPLKTARLTLLAPAGCGPEINGSFVRGMAQGPNRGALAHLMRMLGPKASQLDADALSAMAEGLVAGRLSSLAATTVQGNVQGIDTLAPLLALAGKIPVTAIFGLNDQVIPRDHVFHLPPHVACHMVAAGHMPHWDAADVVADIVAAP